MRALRLALAVLVCSAAAVHAAVPTFWQVSTEAEFLRGEVENLSIDTYGRLSLGPTSTPLHESAAPFLWAMVAAPDGSVYVGSGNEGQVHKIEAAGKSSVFFDAEELEVHAIAPAPAGGIYVATSPDGKIYKVDANGSSSVLFDPPDRYIWSLAFDREGRLIAGTESPGRVFQIDSAGKPFVLLDSPYNEIRTLRVTPDGTIYAAAVNGRGTTADRPAAPPQPEPVQ